MEEPYGYSIVCQTAEGHWNHYALFGELLNAFDYWQTGAFAGAEILDWKKGRFITRQERMVLNRKFNQIKSWD
tara:strand:+ start:1511 stop:1729 length:219 start_codon:yes stop_codon:yes gene_type:complete